MHFPAESRFISTARVTAASIAAELEFSVDAIEDLTMGTNELFAVLLDLAEEGGSHSLAVRYVVADGDDGSVEIAVVGSLAGGATNAGLVLDSLAKSILDTVVDHYEVGADSIRLVKKRAGA